MSIQIEAEDLDEAYALAIKEFNCSIKDLNIDIIQNASNGFLGFFKKQAVISVVLKDGVVAKTKPIKRGVTKDKDKDSGDINLVEIKSNMKKLLVASCFDIEVIEVSRYSENIIYIKLDGTDSSLLIGKEGYRYNSLVAILYNWLNLKYSVQVRLEIATFLETQEESIKSYLVDLYPIIEENKRVKTKILDGILLRISLNILKEKYPEKFIRVRNNHENKKYILIDNRKSV